GDIQLVRDEHGNLVPSTLPAAPPKSNKPRPELIIIADKTDRQPSGDNETVTTAVGVYVLYNFMDGKPPLEFRAQRAVVFMPNEPTTKPAEGEKPAEPVMKATGVYLEGDVTLDQG